MGRHPLHPDHQTMAGKLRYAVFEGPGVTNISLRRAIIVRVRGGAPIEEPYETIVKKIAESSYKITDDEVDILVHKAGSEKAAYEVIVTAATAAGLRRWDMVKKLMENR